MVARRRIARAARQEATGQLGQLPKGGAWRAKSWEAAHDLLAGGGAAGTSSWPQQKAPQIGACFERRTKSASPNSYIPSP